MIATSDNMATDLLIERLGTRAIEEALASAGHHDPASMTPFPTMYELFSVGWGKPDLRDQWKHATQQVRAQILRQTNSTPYQPDPTRSHSGVKLRCGMVRQRRRYLPCARGTASRRGRPGLARPTDHVRRPGYPAGPQRVALYRRESRWPARRSDVQLVRRRQDRPTMGGELSAELAPRSRTDGDRLDAAGRQASLCVDSATIDRYSPGIRRYPRLASVTTGRSCST